MAVHRVLPLPTLCRPSHLPPASGWQGHPVSTKNWHFIVPAEVGAGWAMHGVDGLPACRHAPIPPLSLALTQPCSLAPLQEGQYSLADPTSLCAIADARARGLQGSAHVALPAPDPDAPHHHQASSIFESKMHRLHGAKLAAAGHALHGLRGMPCMATGCFATGAPRCRVCSARPAGCFATGPPRSWLAMSTQSVWSVTKPELVGQGLASTPRPSQRAALHAAGTVHSNGYGHLMRLNGREGGSKRASGRQLMQVRWAARPGKGYTAGFRHGPPVAAG